MNKFRKVFMGAVISGAVVFLMTQFAGTLHAEGCGDKWEGVPTITLQMPGKKEAHKCQKPGEAKEDEAKTKEGEGHHCQKQGEPKEGEQTGCPREKEGCRHHRGIDNITLGFGDLEKYHGHVCPGIALGYRATQVALGQLYPGEIPPRGDQFVVSGIPRACPADGISYITGARYGKGSEGAFNGNFAFDKAIGASSFFFASMTTGKAVKLTSVFQYPKEMEELKAKKDTDPEANVKYEAMSRCVTIRILTAPEKEVFEVTPVPECNWKECKEKYSK